MSVVFAGLAVGLMMVGALAVMVHRFGRQRPEPSARDVIVVLGARVNDDGSPSEALVARVHHAVAWHRLGAAPLVLFSGGRVTGPVAEAVIAHRLAIEAGLPPSACLIEAQSTSTFTNASASTAVLDALGLKRVWLVTDDFHAARAAAHFRRAGLSVRVAPVHRGLSLTSRVFWTLREIIALMRRPWVVRFAEPPFARGSRRLDE